MRRWLIGSFVLATACARPTAPPPETNVATSPPPQPEPAEPESAAPAPDESAELELRVRSGGIFDFDGRRRSGDELPELLRAVPAERRIVVTADRALEWGAIVSTLDLLRLHGGDARAFVLAVSGDGKQRTRPIAFPRAAGIVAADDAHEPPVLPVLVVSIDREGRRYVGRKVVEASVERALAEAVHEEDQVVVIQADKAAAFSTVVEVALAAQEAGARIAFGVVVSSSSPPPPVAP